MAEDKDSGEKTEEPTQQRREDFRKRGQVAQTKELASVFTLLSALLGMWLLGRFFLEQLFLVFNSSFGDFLIRAARDGEWVAAFRFAMEKTFVLVAPIMGFMWLVSFSASTVQVGFLFNEEALQFKPERLNPLEGFKRVFSLRSLMEGLKAIFKVIIVGSIAAVVIQAELFRVPTLVSYSVEQLFAYVGGVTIQILGGVGFFMLVLSGLDFLFQKWDLEKKMKMTKQELKEEMKSKEGDPLIKARIRKIQREIANKRMMEDVPKADVIITNPTHLAIAIKYSENMVAPTVIAKGADHLAEKIRNLAKEHKIPIVENKPLARAIYKTIKIGQAIPRELYTAVAEVLAYVYQLRRKKKRGIH